MADNFIVNSNNTQVQRVNNSLKHETPQQKANLNEMVAVDQSNHQNIEAADKKDLEESHLKILTLINEPIILIDSR